MTKIRRSFDMGKKREVTNTVVQDCTNHRLEKDIMAASVTDSMMGTGFASKGGARRTASMFKARTGSNFANMAANINGATSPTLRDGPV